MLRFAANLTWMYAEHALNDRFAAAARDGFTAVELLFPYEQTASSLAAQLRDHGLSLILMNAPPGNWEDGERGMACIPGKQKAFRESMETALAYARTLGCSRVHVMAGAEPAGVERSVLRDTYLSNLSWAGGRAAAEGVKLLIEPINRRDVPGYFLNSQQDAHEIVDEIGNPALHVQMDLYHCQIIEGDVSTKLRKYLPGKNVGHIQIASVPDRNEPDSGELDYGYLLRLIDSLNYDGWIGCEYRPRARTSEGLGWLRRF